MSHLTPFQIFLLVSIIKIAVVLVITLTAVAYTVLLERKVLGRLQNRWGPSRVGPFGLLQPLADGIKLFLKEDMMPLAVERPLFILAPLIALSCALVSISMVPFGHQTFVSVNGTKVDLFQISDINIGLLVILGITSIGVYGVALSGWSSNNKYSLFGSLRASAQLVSYELALGLSLVGVVMRAHSLRLRDIVGSQSAHGLLSWNVLGGFHIVAFFIYFMAEYANMITVACVATLLFLGGANSPFGHIFDNVAVLNGPVIGAILPIFWFVVKILFFLLLYIWVRGTLPRFRYDQLMNFGWKFLLPVAILNILATALALAYRS